MPIFFFSWNFDTVFGEQKAIFYQLYKSGSSKFFFKCPQFTKVLRVASSNYAIKIKQIYIQMEKIDEVKSWINCVEIRGKSSTFKWWNPDYLFMTYKGH